MAVKRELDYDAVGRWACVAIVAVGVSVGLFAGAHTGVVAARGACVIAGVGLLALIVVRG